MFAHVHKMVKKSGEFDDVSITEFFASDVVRHPMVTKIVNAYDQREGKQFYKVPAQ